MTHFWYKITTYVGKSFRTNGTLNTKARTLELVLSIFFFFSSIKQYARTDIRILLYLQEKPIYMSNEVSACMDPVLRKFEAFRRRHTKNKRSHKNTCSYVTGSSKKWPLISLNYLCFLLNYSLEGGVKPAKNSLTTRLKRKSDKHHFFPGQLALTSVRYE